MTWMRMEAEGALSGRHSQTPERLVVTSWRRRETTVTSDLSTIRLTPDWRADTWRERYDGWLAWVWRL